MQSWSPRPRKDRAGWSGSQVTGNTPPCRATRGPGSLASTSRRRWAKPPGFQGAGRSSPPGAGAGSKVTGRDLRALHVRRSVTSRGPPLPAPHRAGYTRRSTARSDAMSADPYSLRPIATLGFIGLGIMGEPMCGHLARRCGRRVLAHDLRLDPLQRLAADGVESVQAADIAHRADLIVLSLPDGRAVAAVIATLEPHLQPGQTVVDTSTSSVPLTRTIGARLAARGIAYADAPVARTREAAARGELSIMVGATDAVFAHVRPILETMGTDVTHCGPIGTGQVAKVLNNMLVS